MTATQPIFVADRGIDELSHPWIRTLETFAIPFFSYTGDGRRIYASAAAESLVELTAPGPLLAEQADAAMATELGWSGHSLRLRPFALAREVPSCLDGMILAVHVATPPVGGVCGIVVVRAATARPNASNPLQGLTSRESEVARLIAMGLPTKTIAFRLGISTHTTRHHTERVFAKLGVRSRSSLAARLAGHTTLAF